MKKLFLAGILLIMLLSSCGPVVRVKITGTKDGVNVTTTQTARDSTGLNIQVNPNINLK